MISPIVSILLWLDEQPVTIRKFLTHFFRVCSTENTSIIAEDPVESLDKFRIWMIKSDFPMRRLAKVLHVIAIFDMAINHKNKILQRAEFKAHLFDENVFDFTFAQWDKTCLSWHNSRQRELSDTYVNTWAELVIDNKVED